MQNSTSSHIQKFVFPFFVVTDSIVLSSVQISPRRGPHGQRAYLD